MHYITNSRVGFYSVLVAYRHEANGHPARDAITTYGSRAGASTLLSRLMVHKSWIGTLACIWLLALGMVVLLAFPADVRADDVAPAAGSDPRSADAAQTWAVHGQLTYINQWHNSFKAPYSGTNSLDARARNNETADVSLMVGRRLWTGAQAWIYGEYDQGFGFNNTVGAAGFPNGEAYKVGANTPYFRLPRAFVRQVFPLGAEMETVDAAAGQLAGSRPVDNVILTIGKFSVVDIFDNNSYAHDPRGDFMNWSIIDAGPFDYAADSWGFTNGAAVEWNRGDWTLRGGAFQLSESPNAKVAGIHFRQHSFIAEAERRHVLNTLPGKLKLLAFTNRGDMGSYAEAVSRARRDNTVPETALVRRYGSNTGLTFNVEQALSSNLGFFARAGINQGKKETFEFTDVNRSFAVGLSLQGGQWGRASDRLGVAAVINALSPNARSYFSQGGVGVLIGDGQLNYAPEKLVEAYYSLAVIKGTYLSADYQRIDNPAYNRDRGPVSIYAIRAHSEF